MTSRLEFPQSSGDLFNQPLITTTHSIHHIRDPVKNSSISYRDLPSVSFKTLESCIHHYREKAKGKYGEKVAARYLFDMSNELEKQINILKDKEGTEMKRLYKEIQWLRRVVKEWELCFGMEFSPEIENSDKENKSLNDQLLHSKIERLTPEQVKRRLDFQDKEIKKLKKQIEEQTIDAERKRHVHQKGVEEAHEQARRSLHSQIQLINDKVMEMHKQNELSFRQALQSKNNLITTLENEISELKKTISPLKDTVEEYKSYSEHVFRQMKVMKDTLSASKQLNEALNKSLKQAQIEVFKNEERLKKRLENHNIQQEDNNSKDENLLSEEIEIPYISNQIPSISSSHTSSNIINQNHIIMDKKFREIEQFYMQKIIRKDEEIEQLKNLNLKAFEEISKLTSLIQELEGAKLMDEFYKIKKQIPQILNSQNELRQTIPDHGFFENKQKDHHIRRKEHEWSQNRTKSKNIENQISFKKP